MVVKRKHEELEPEKVETAASSSSRLMQGQGDNKHSIDSDDEEDDRKAEERFDKIKEDDIEGQEDETVTLDGGEFRQLAGEFNKLQKITPEQWDFMEQIIRSTNKKSKA